MSTSPARKVLTPKCGPHPSPERGGSIPKTHLSVSQRAQRFRGGTECPCGGFVGQAGVAPLVPLFNRVPGCDRDHLTRECAVLILCCSPVEAISRTHVHAHERLQGSPGHSIPPPPCWNLNRTSVVCAHASLPDVLTLAVSVHRSVPTVDKKQAEGWVGREIC